MPRYIVIVKDKESGKPKLHSYTADSALQAKQMAEGDGLEVVEVVEDVPPPSGPRTYELLKWAGWILTDVGMVTTVVGLLMGLVGLFERSGTPWFGWSLALSSVLSVGMGQAMLALRDIAINSFPPPPVK